MDSLYRLGGHDYRNLPSGEAAVRRQLMNELIALDVRHGVPMSARPHHNVSNWILLLACLPPNDESDGVTLEEIHEILVDMEFDIRMQSVLNAFRPMVSRNPRTIDEMSNINRLILSRIGGIQSTRINEDGRSVGSYTLGIGIRKLEELVFKKEFVTYSFNLNDQNGVLLCGGM